MTIHEALDPGPLAWRTRRTRGRAKPGLKKGTPPLGDDQKVGWYGLILVILSIPIQYNVNPGLINHGLLIRGYSSNSHNPMLQW